MKLLGTNTIQLSNQDAQIAQATMGRKVSELTDQQLDTIVLALLEKTLLVLGHKNQFTSEHDMELMSDEVTSLIRQQYSAYTDDELKLVFTMGARGEFRSKPEEIIFLNLANVNTWLKTYKYSQKSEVMKKLQPVTVGSEPVPELDKVAELQAFLARIQTGQEPTEIDWIIQSGLHYPWLDADGKLGLTLEDKKRIYQEEKDKVSRNAKYNLDHVNLVTKHAYQAFVAKSGGANQYEKQVLTNCRIRAFREWVEKQIQSKKQ